MKNPTIRTYDIYIADLNATVGSEIRKIRPVAVVSQDEMNTHLKTIVVCPLATRLHPKWRSRIQILCENRKAEIAVDRIRTISKRRLIRKVDSLPDADSARLRKLITDMYGE